MRKTTFTVMSVMVVLMALSLAFLVPSGAITEDAATRYTDATYQETDEDGFAEIARRELKPVAILANAAISDVLPAEKIQPLPIDLATPGNAPIAENFTETGYHDDTIIVEMEQKRLYDSNVFIATVKISTPSQLRTAVAGDKISSTRTNHTSKITENYNGIVGVNGDYYTKTKGGVIVRQGETFREKFSDNLDLLLIDEMGDFHILLKGVDSQKSELAALRAEHQVVNGFFFGPGLVVDGKAREIPEKYQFDPNAKNPRAGIAQLAPLTYAIVVVNGRTEASAGVTMTEFADVMMQLGAQQAYNLDGGNSATLAFHGAVYNDKPQAERTVTDIIYFTSATQQK
ncbi:MAG: phosphodiester glycosidase family protein [Clostridia bacterium]